MDDSGAANLIPRYGNPLPAPRSAETRKPPSNFLPG